MKTHPGFSGLALIAFVMTAMVGAAFADSHVRIVRLSSVEGQVQIDRATGQGLERAILNTPIVEGTRIVTGADGLAEVEFENQSALRLTENSEVKFTQLLMNDAGTKTNRITVEKGLVYVDTASKGDDSYVVTVGDRSLTVGRDTSMRLSATPDQLQVAVFKGEADLEGQAQPLVVHKKETLTVDLKAASQDVVAKGVEQNQFDNWNKEREDYGKTYADNQGYGGPSRAYGLQDLNYYGDFFYAGGYGYVWQPYGFAGSMVNWNPYMNGAWMFYPGMGYAWASAYPWGWLPFHYGSWAFINGAGWAWIPGRYNGQWYSNGYQTVPRVTKAPTGWTAPAPPATTASTSSQTVVVGKAGTTPLSIPGDVFLRTSPAWFQDAPRPRQAHTGSYIPPPQRRPPATPYSWLPTPEWQRRIRTQTVTSSRSRCGEVFLRKRWYPLPLRAAGQQVLPRGVCIAESPQLRLIARPAAARTSNNRCRSSGGLIRPPFSCAKGALTIGFFRALAWYHRFHSAPKD